MIHPYFRFGYLLLFDKLSFCLSNFWFYISRPWMHKMPEWKLSHFLAFLNCLESLGYFHETLYCFSFAFTFFFHPWRSHKQPQRASLITRAPDCRNDVRIDLVQPTNYLDFRLWIWCLMCSLLTVDCECYNAL